MARIIKVNEKTGNLRCDYCHKIIPMGKTATQVVEGKAQGLYHGVEHFQLARANYEKIQKESNISDEDIE